MHRTSDMQTVLVAQKQKFQFISQQVIVKAQSTCLNNVEQCMNNVQNDDWSVGRPYIIHDTSTKMKNTDIDLLPIKSLKHWCQRRFVCVWSSYANRAIFHRTFMAYCSIPWNTTISSTTTKFCRVTLNIVNHWNPLALLINKLQEQLLCQSHASSCIIHLPFYAQCNRLPTHN